MPTRTFKDRMSVGKGADQIEQRRGHLQRAQVTLMLIVIIGGGM
jgi:hypothetical protein